MLHALFNKKLKDSFSDQTFKPSEDSLTSSVIGLMQYLPADAIWSLLKISCGSLSKLPEISGELLSIEFWPSLQSDGIYNSTRVEPDVVIEFSEFDLLIESKKNDGGGQYREQWEKELISYKKGMLDERKPIFFIALGGNKSLIDIDLDINGNKFTICTASWYNLLNSTYKYYNQLLKIEDKSSSVNCEIRIVQDIIRAFNKHGYTCIEWFNTFNTMTICESYYSVIENWDFDNKPLLLNFNDRTRFEINYIDSIFDLWKIQ